MLSKIKWAIEEPEKILPHLLFLAKRFLSDVCDTTIIREINVEFVNYCNLRCKWCSLDHTQKKYVMSEDLLKKLLDNLVSDTRFNSVKRILIWSGGETLLHPRFMNMFRIIKGYKDSFLKQKLPFPSIILLTNGIPLHKEASKELVSLDVLDSIKFSVDGGSKEKYEEIRRLAKWDVVSKNIRDFIEVNNGKIETGIVCIIEYGKERNMGWMSEEFKDLLKLADVVELRYPHDWIGDVKIDGSPKKDFQNRCKFLSHSLVVLPNGYVTVCCADLNGIGVIGNLYKESLYQICDSEKRKEMIRYFKKGRRDKIELCKNCKGYYP